MALHFPQRGESQDELLGPPEDNSGCGFQVLSPRDCAGPVSPNTFVPPSLRSVLPLGYARRPGVRWQLTRGLTSRPPCLATQGHGVPKRMVLFVLMVEQLRVFYGFSACNTTQIENPEHISVPCFLCQVTVSTPSCVCGHLL